MTLLEGKKYSLLVLCGDAPVVKYMNEIDNEGKGR
jgi:hypothetical protein